MFEDFEASYLIGHLVTWLVLILSLVVFARLRPWRSRRIVVRVAVRLFVPVWCITALATALEGGFALSYDTTDSFNLLNTSKRWYARHVRANNMGYRDRKDFSLTIPSGKKRIVLMGDSFAFGHGIARPEQRFGDLIEARLADAYPGEFQFYNTALPGFDTQHHLFLMNEWRRTGFETDAVVLVYVLNDLEDLVRENSDMMIAIGQSRPSFWLWRKTYLFNFCYFRWHQFRRPESRDYFTWLKDSYRGDVWDRQRLQLDAIRARCQERGTKLHVVVFPFLQYLGESYPFREAHEVVGDYWRTNSVPAIDLLPIMEAHSADALVVNRFDAHPNERAHALAADALWDGVIRELADSLRSP